MVVAETELSFLASERSFANFKSTTGDNDSLGMVSSRGGGSGNRQGTHEGCTVRSNVGELGSGKNAVR